MFIKNNAPRLHQIGATKDTPMIQLLPGINTVDAAAWAKAEEIDMVKHYIKTKELQVVDSKADSLSDKSAADAVRVAADTFDMALLKQWLEAETRARVAKALQAQIDLVNAAGDVTPKEE